jgi:hypothetical protein
MFGPSNRTEERELSEQLEEKLLQQMQQQAKTQPRKMYDTELKIQQFSVLISAM